MALTTTQTRYVVTAWVEQAYPAGPTQEPVPFTKTQIAQVVGLVDAGDVASIPAAFKSKTTAAQRNLMVALVDGVKNPPPVVEPEPYVDPLDEIRERLAALEAKVG